MKTLGRQKASAEERNELASGETEHPARARIISAAEVLFAELGFDGASIRQIALAAKVPLALVSYHFGSKEGLYRAIFELRAPSIVEQRKTGLLLADAEKDPERRLELVVKALLIPMLKLRREEKSARFGALLAREVSDPKSLDRGIIRDMFDPVARAFIQAMREVLPDRTNAEINWAYQVMIGAMVHVMGDAGRIVRLSDGACDPEDDQQTTVHIVSLLLAAVRHGSKM
ncbi:CerR family C-terminal domain-containing protein [Roseiarcaceae bacterium H3SJ34-1]|uniref:TetR/AcrR family transcriptional regulator n=1 Tax=Terripilifer ovatus TaxID=3032367 RepID=UPI003AB94169|nr:CerR family C-terminal domain-containing protein [Roseiarcaceae bacterium H3SJ34-1]